MSINFLGRSFWALLYAGLLGSAIHSGNDRELGLELKEKQPRFSPYIPPCLLPIYLVMFPVMALILDLLTDWHIDYRSPSYAFLMVVLHIGTYYIILAPLLPFFRRHFSARTCAMLWLLPNYLYIIVYDFMEIPTPLLVIPISTPILRVISVIWIIGFVGVLAWHLISHLRFRRKLLREAIPVTDPAILELWQKELEFAGLKKKKYRLLRSPATQTPLSVGFFQRSIRVVLPQRYYSPEDLALILRHEIIHIGREDSGTKFFLVFCTALCWFNPLMWLAMRRSADDLELSCDETVLLEADDATRRHYADLLLRTAGDERGFTTCLSASAQALRYRLEHVLHPRKRWAGALAIIVVFYVLVMSCGYVAFGFNQISGQDLIFGGANTSGYTLESVSRQENPNDLNRYFYHYDCTDEEALNNYLAGLNFCTVSGRYSFSDDSQGVTIHYTTPQSQLSLYLEADSLRLVTRDEHTSSATYYCTDKLDWDLLYSLIAPHPRLDVALTDPDVTYHFERNLSSHAHILRTKSGGVTKEYPPASPDSVTGSYSQELRYRTATFSFTHKLYDGTFEVQVENWDRTSSYTVSSEEFAYPLQFELAPYFAHYTVRATIVDDKGVIYDTEYRFDLGPLDG